MIKEILKLIKEILKLILLNNRLKRKAWLADYAILFL